MKSRLDEIKANHEFRKDEGWELTTLKEDIDWLIDQAERVHEQADLLRKYREVLKEIAHYPKVRGVGGLMDSYNEIITLAEFAIRRV